MRIVIVLLLLPYFLLGATEKNKIISSETTMTISEKGTGVLHYKKRMMIADKAGESLAEILISVNDYVSLDNVTVQVLDSRGKKKKKFKKRHFVQVEGLTSGSLASDALHYYLNASDVIPKPFMVEVEYTLDISSLFFWRAWSPQEKFPVEQTSYLLNVPKNFKYHSFNPGGIQSESLNPTSYRWTYSNIESYPDEYAMPSDVSDKYTVFFAPDQFELDGYTGRCSSWGDVGDFYWGLTKDQFQLDPASVTNLKLDSCETKLDTIAQIYQYVQEKTRYVAISLGIHGWKPHTSQSVCDNKYGDCKDLSTFFISILSHYGIKANPVLILTNSAGKVYPDLPGTRFNHVITCIPLMDDTLWVDCTYDDGTINYLPPNDQGCNVLVVAEGNSYLTTTPILPSNDNQRIFKASIVLNPDGSANMSGELKFIGTAALRMRMIFVGGTEKEKQEYIVSLFRESAPGFELEDYSLPNLHLKTEPLILNLEGRVPHLGSRSGTRMFTNLSLPSGIGWNGEHPARRTLPYDAGSPSIYSSEITLAYPENIIVESLPRDFHIETPFGSYKSFCSNEGDKVSAVWRFEDNMPRIPLEKYAEFYQFRQSVGKASSSQLVLAKP